MKVVEDEIIFETVYTYFSLDLTYRLQIVFNANRDLKENCKGYNFNSLQFFVKMSISREKCEKRVFRHKRLYVCVE